MLQKKTKPKLRIRTDREDIDVEIENIVHIETIPGKADYITITIPEGTYVTQRTLKDILVKLPATFSRIHKSTIINRDKVIELIGNKAILKLTDTKKTSLSIGRVYAKELKHAISSS